MNDDMIPELLAEAQADLRARLAKLGKIAFAIKAERDALLDELADTKRALAEARVELAALKSRSQL